ncbi:I78 family peptidase inhibitor [Rhodobacter sp. SY28-1]|uniref:I78 family peptidase inhibitor n=1 Tax=Rhodobacter sp. SY28-1 TaxID=2562317 RepID=UPI0010C06637|nr:I78 family peptidase inhibitor [Rhodobacter sp. SY28-1]
MRAAIALLALGLAGCTPELDELYMPTTPVDLAACGADKLQNLVGQPRSVLDGMRFRQEVLVLDPASPVPADLVPERLVIELLEYDTITVVTCG